MRQVCIFKNRRKYYVLLLILIFMHVRRRQRSRMQHAKSITSPSRHALLATLPRLHSSRLHVPCDKAILVSIVSPLVRGRQLSSRQLCPALITRSPPMLRFHSSALVDCRWAIVQGRPLQPLALLHLARLHPRPPSAPPIFPSAVTTPPPLAPSPRRLPRVVASLRR